MFRLHVLYTWWGQYLILLGDEPDEIFQSLIYEESNFPFEMVKWSTEDSIVSVLSTEESNCVSTIYWR